MRPTRELPPNYRPAGSIDLSKDTRLALLLNLAALGLLLIFGALGVRLVHWLRPEPGALQLMVRGASVLLLLTLLLALLAFQIALHELIHGLIFWLITRSRPHYGFKGVYAYAGAPDWYLPRGQHMAAALAPLLLISAGCLLLLRAAPLSWLPGILLVLIVNASGSIGDLLVVAWLLTKPPVVLIRDSGDAVSLFLPA